MEPVVVSFAVGSEFELSVAENIIRYELGRAIVPGVDGAIQVNIIPKGHTEPGSDPPRILDVACSVYTFWYAIEPAEAKVVAKAINERASDGKILPGTYTQEMLKELQPTLAPAQVIQVRDKGFMINDAYASKLVELNPGA